MIKAKRIEDSQVYRFIILKQDQTIKPKIKKKKLTNIIHFISVTENLLGEELNVDVEENTELCDKVNTQRVQKSRKQEWCEKIQKVFHCKK